MSTATDDEWLAGLKAGDEVAVDYGRGSQRYLIQKVAKRTPTGRIVLDDGGQYSRSGTRSPDRYMFYRLERVTDEIRESIDRRRLLGILSHARWDVLSTEALRSVTRTVAAGTRRSRKGADPMTPSTEPRHCDEYIDDETAAPSLRAWLSVARAPAHGALQIAKGHNPRLFADLNGRRVRCVMASRFGDIGVTEDLTAEYGYSARVAVEDLTNFGDVP